MPEMMSAREHRSSEFLSVVRILLNDKLFFLSTQDYYNSEIAKHKNVRPGSHIVYLCFGNPIHNVHRNR